MGALLCLLHIGLRAGPGAPHGDPAARILAWVCCPARAARSPQALNQQFLPSCGARAAPTALLLLGWLQACRDWGALPAGRGCSEPHCPAEPPPCAHPGACASAAGTVRGRWHHLLEAAAHPGGRCWGDTPPQAGESRLGRPSSPSCPRMRSRVRRLPAPQPRTASSPSPSAADRLLHAALGAGHHAEPRRLHPVLPERAAGEDPGGLREGEAEQGQPQRPPGLHKQLVPGCRALGTRGAAELGSGGGMCWWLSGEALSPELSQCFLSPGEGLVRLLPGPLGAPACLLQPAERDADHVPQPQLPEHPCGTQGGGPGGYKGSLGSSHALRALQLTPLLPRISSSVSAA